jgi:hypothetical protein
VNGNVSSWLSLVLLLGGSVVAWLQYRASNRHTRQERTLHLDQAIDSLSATRLRLERELPRTLVTIGVEHVQDAGSRGPDLEFEISLRTFLARLQIFCLAVSSGMAEEDFAFELLGSTIVWYGTAYKPYIVSIRQTNAQPLLYGDLLYIAERWSSRLEIETNLVAETGYPYFGRSRRSRRLTIRSARTRTRHLKPGISA